MIAGMHANQHLYLIGYRGCGKTTVARRLALLNKQTWIDADEELERRAGKTIREIFAESGEKHFRDLESQLLASLAEGTHHIIALGGGAVLREGNRNLIKRSGKVVWLRARPETLLARIQADPTTGDRRPSLTSAGGLEEIEQLLQVRTPLYAACADYIVDVDELTPEAVAEQIAH